MTTELITFDSFQSIRTDMVQEERFLKRTKRNPMISSLTHLSSLIYQWIFRILLVLVLLLLLQSLFSSIIYCQLLLFISWSIAIDIHSSIHLSRYSLSNDRCINTRQILCILNQKRRRRLAEAHRHSSSRRFISNSASLTGRSNVKPIH